MPPVSSPGSHDSHRQGPRSSAGDRAARVRFRRAIALMVMTLALPGSAQLVAGNPRSAGSPCASGSASPRSSC